MRWPNAERAPVPVRFRRAAILLTVSVLALGVGEASARKPLKRGAEHSGQGVELATGDTLEVALGGNPATGYAWEMVAGKTILKQVGDPAFQPRRRRLPGSGGKVIFRFVATGPGRTELEMIYHRPWEKDVPPRKTFKLTIAVR